jgi:hypothetical protein
MRYLANWNIAETLYARSCRSHGVLESWKFRLAFWLTRVDVSRLLCKATFRAVVLDELERYEPVRVSRATAVVLEKQKKLKEEEEAERGDR